MGEQISISELGIKLIKTYEGFYEEVRQLPSYGHVIGYGHRTQADDERTLSRTDAEMLLREDLMPIETLINDVVHAPLTQSQFDALCSLVFNIGQKAFLGSDILEALNNGRTLDAANGFDAWRKSAVNGKIYIIDALVRRRTAEKALFLRPEGRRIVASRIDVVPVVDETVAMAEDDEVLALMSEEDNTAEDGGISEETDLSLDVEIANDSDVLDIETDSDATEQEAAEITEMPAVSEVTELAEIKSDDLVADSRETDIGDIPNLAAELEDEDMAPSPIAEAAAEVVERLDALIESDPEGEDVNLDISTDDVQGGHDIVVLDEKLEFDQGSEDEQAQNSAQALSSSSTAQSETYTPQYTAQVTTSPARAPSKRPLYIMMGLGMVLMIGLFVVMQNNVEGLLGGYGHFISMAGFLIGAMIFLGAFYTYLKNIARARQTVFQT